MYLFNLLKEVEKLGYEILTYEEAREELGIEPKNIDKIYFYFVLENKLYFIFNNSIKNINKYISIFLKKQKLTLIKNKLFSILEKNKDVL